ncbi:dipeptide epimerase [Ferruginibacter paludis]|uniref:mandelate racemase/muconate lactonizing enzyme family protein n=1 Tax=Ferruginibacter paludis TaxID=1310417 RepID=UPI0025B39121|nr:dipeptide epimerase [Ferruginibacter paludis]MDN3656649.1 dipeptide epimerase [Ferruginibacter paludis]
MKIKSVKAWLQHLPLTKPYTIAYKTIADTEIIFLEIVLENGIIGLGASNPFAEVVGETPAMALANLQSDFVQQLTGRDIRHFNQLIDEALVQFPHLPGTIAAIDIALHDAFCQLIGIPVVDLYGRKMNALPTSITIGIKDTAAMLEEAKANYAAGFKVIKIKTGLDVEEDIERVTKLTEQFGNNMLIRVDANQGYDLKQLQKFIHKTKDLSIELIEQPMKAGKESELAGLDSADRKKLAADESLLDAASALQLSHPPTPFGIFNIKLMKCGGIRGAREIATIAAAAGIDLFWGCNDESIVSITAALHAAFSCSNTKYLDLDGSFDLSSDLVTGGFILKDGVMYCSDGTGLGLHRL